MACIYYKYVHPFSSQHFNDVDLNFTVTIYSDKCLFLTAEVGRLKMEKRMTPVNFSKGRANDPEVSVI